MHSGNDHHIHQLKVNDLLNHSVQKSFLLVVSERHYEVAKFEAFRAKTQACHITMITHNGTCNVMALIVHLAFKFSDL